VLEPRERRTIGIAAAVCAVALLVAYVVMPLARRWSARETMIDARIARLVRLERALANEPALRVAVTAREAQRDASAQTLLTGRTPALAAAALQSLIRDYAARSDVTISQLDAAGQPDTVAGLPAVPASISAIGDVYGITSLLGLLQYGTTMLDIHELRVAPNPALRGQLLQLAVTVRAPFTTE
jgi:hypothetical protein